MPNYVPTNAASSGIKLERKVLKAILARSNKPGLIYLTQWLAVLCLSGTLIWVAQESSWVWPAMFVYGAFLTVPAYAFSHETAHGTAFRSRWFNETVFWLTSLIYMEEPLHRRYTHTNHHTHTWHVGKDSQMPFDTPMGFAGWLVEITGFALLRFHAITLTRLAFSAYSNVMRDVTPEGELPKMTRNARIFLAVYVAIACLIVMGHSWLLWYLVLPRFLGAPVMLLFTLIQHVELQENSQSILESTRSFKTPWLGRFLYMNMNHHVEHHLYPQVPFYGLPRLAKAVREQLPEPDPGLFRTNWEVLVVVLRRTLGLSTKAKSIRQASHMITGGGSVTRVAHRTM